MLRAAKSSQTILMKSSWQKHNWRNILRRNIIKNIYTTTRRILLFIPNFKEERS